MTNRGASNGWAYLALVVVIGGPVLAYACGAGNALGQLLGWLF